MPIHLLSRKIKHSTSYLKLCQVSDQIDQWCLGSFERSWISLVSKKWVSFFHTFCSIEIFAWFYHKLFIWHHFASLKKTTRASLETVHYNRRRKTKMKSFHNDTLQIRKQRFYNTVITIEFKYICISFFLIYTYHLEN